MKIINIDRYIAYDWISTTLIVAAVLAVAIGWVWFLGWVIVSVIGWFGPHLAVWQGCVISFLASVLFRRNS